jgi:hypothetical protein
MESLADASWQPQQSGGVTAAAALVRQHSPAPTAGAYLQRRSTPTSGASWAASADPFYPAAAYGGAHASSTGTTTSSGHPYLSVEADAAAGGNMNAWAAPRLTSPPPAVVPSRSTGAGPTAVDLWAMATLHAAGGAADRDLATFAALQFQAAAAAAAAAAYQDAASMGYSGGGTERGQRAYHGAIPMINIDEADAVPVPHAPRSRPSSVELVQNSMNAAFWAQYYANNNGYGVGASDAQSMPTSPTGMLGGYNEAPARLPGQTMSPPHQRPMMRSPGASSSGAQAAAAAAAAAVAVAADDPKRTSLYKTELCRSFEESGFCRYGAKCQFAHGQGRCCTLAVMVSQLLVD